MAVGSFRWRPVVVMTKLARASSWRDDLARTPRAIEGSTHRMMRRHGGRLSLWPRSHAAVLGWLLHHLRLAALAQPSRTFLIPGGLIRTQPKAYPKERLRHHFA